MSTIVPDPCPELRELVDRITRLASSLSLEPADAMRRIRDLLLDYDEGAASGTDPRACRPGPPR